MDLSLYCLFVPISEREIEAHRASTIRWKNPDILETNGSTQAGYAGRIVLVASFPRGSPEALSGWKTTCPWPGNTYVIRYGRSLPQGASLRRPGSTGGCCIEASVALS